MANIIDAIINLVQDDDLQLKSHHIGTNRANISGDNLEDFIKDLFAGTLGFEERRRLRRLGEVFSYTGNSSNPPDAMLRGGDAIEIKKIESDNSSLALNSSYPKHTLKSTNPMINAACKNAENWHEKDMLYAIGVVKKGSNTLKHLCMVYGTNYCASDYIYERIREKIKEGVETIPGIDFTPSKELGHINNVDPLGITYLRVRGMWGIKNPWYVFDYIYQRPIDKVFTFMCIIDDRKWNILPNTFKLISLAARVPSLHISDEYTKNPDNPSQLDKVKLITYYK